MILFNLIEDNDNLTIETDKPLTVDKELWRKAPIKSINANGYTVQSRVINGQMTITQNQVLMIGA